MKLIKMIIVLKKKMNREEVAKGECRLEKLLILMHFSIKSPNQTTVAINQVKKIKKIKIILTIIIILMKIKKHIKKSMKQKMKIKN